MALFPDSNHPKACQFIRARSIHAYSAPAITQQSLFKGLLEPSPEDWARQVIDHEYFKKVTRSRSAKSSQIEYTYWASLYISDLTRRRLVFDTTIQWKNQFFSNTRPIITTESTNIYIDHCHWILPPAPLTPAYLITSSQYCYNCNVIDGKIDPRSAIDTNRIVGNHHPFAKKSNRQFACPRDYKC